MSFAKAQNLLRLAQMAASRRGDVSLEDICIEFGVSHRTAHRMTEALDAAFANVTTTDFEDRRRYWRLDVPPPERLQPRQETTIEALEIAARTARDQARLRHARANEDLRDGLLARLNLRDATRSEADAEAVLAGFGQVMRPGPTVALRPEVTDAGIEALRGLFPLRVTYGSSDAAPRADRTPRSAAGSPQLPCGAAASAQRDDPELPHGPSCAINWSMAGRPGTAGSTGRRCATALQSLAITWTAMPPGPRIFCSGRRAASARSTSQTSPPASAASKSSTSKPVTVLAGRCPVPET